MAEENGLANIQSRVRFRATSLKWPDRVAGRRNKTPETFGQLDANLKDFDVTGPLTEVRVG
ncbi:MAG: hypothetical protein OSB05_11165 [Akkermansiaceae bacterium]|nr:hypothetical protein [Akkermansiaceae bacterium]